MNYAGLLSDFDGTIHLHDQHISPGVLTALRRLCEAGYKFGFSTGRQFDYIRPYARQFGEAHVVCGGACLVSGEGQLIHQEVIPEAIVREIFEAVQASDGIIVLKHFDMGYGNAAALELARERPGLNLLPVAELQDWNLPSFYLTTDDDLCDRLAERTDVTMIRQRHRSGMPGGFIDGTPLGVTKAAGVQWWCDYHHLDPEAVIGIGDGENDVGLFKAVGLGLAMGNAVPELLPHAGAVVPGIEADGVAWAIARYFNV